MWISYSFLFINQNNNIKNRFDQFFCYTNNLKNLFDWLSFPWAGQHSKLGVRKTHFGGLSSLSSWGNVQLKCLYKNIRNKASFTLWQIQFSCLFTCFRFLVNKLIENALLRSHIREHLCSWIGMTPMLHLNEQPIRVWVCRQVWAAGLFKVHYYDEFVAPFFIIFVFFLFCGTIQSDRRSRKGKKL